MAGMSNIASLATTARQKNPTNVRVGRNVRYIMSVRTVTQVQLALELGLTESQVSRRVTGSVDWTPEDLEKTARLLKVSVGDLFTLKLPGLDSNQEPIGLQLRDVAYLADRPQKVREDRERDATITTLRFA